jgi:hypothetical protein
MRIAFTDNNGGIAAVPIIRHPIPFVEARNHRGFGIVERPLASNYHRSFVNSIKNPVV